MSSHLVENNPANSRYEISVDGVLAGFTEYYEDGDVLVFPHTQIFEAFGGQGLAAILITAALDDVRAKGRLIRPLCPFVAAFIAKHPDYQDLVA